jgi:hypothetical protein
MNNNIEDDNADYNIDIMKQLKIIQSIYYNYISNYTENQHLRLVFSHYGMQLYKKFTPDELLEIFPHKNKLINY